MKELKLHLGCGKRYLPGYCHVDLAGYKHIDDNQNIKNLIGFENSSVDLIYCSHAISYFDPSEVVYIFKHWRRLLKKRGVLRIATPDLQALMKVYIITANINLITGPLYGKWKIRGNFETIYHKMVYDYNSLSTALRSAGFHKIQRWNWREVFKDNPKLSFA